MAFLELVSRYPQDFAGWLALIDLVLVTLTILWVLHIKKEPMSAIAWCLAVVLLPFVGPLLFVLFGYQTVQRPLARRKKQRVAYRKQVGKPGEQGGTEVQPPPGWEVMANLAHHPDGFPVTGGNRVSLYHCGEPAYAAMLDAIRKAEKHVHMEFFIVRPDDSGRAFINALCERAARGVEVRFLYDSLGSYNISSGMVRKLRREGGQAVAFLPVLNPLYRMRVNLRNHRKILVVDGQTAFTGGLNIGDEYLGKHPKFGYWRDTFLKVDGPAARSLQRVFLEDWYFAAGEALDPDRYSPKTPPPAGGSIVQVVHSGPDQEYKAIRETYFAGILRAKKRVWIASPYYVPDPGLRDALILAGRSGVDVRFLGLFRPDKWVPFLAARYYWGDLLAAGVKVYQYARGMMHAKYMLVDGEWASIGSANTDNRSLLLNFEANCLLYDKELVAEMERAFLDDLDWSVRIDPEVYAARPFLSRLAENGCRLFSPIL